ncbi:hypothetical protein BC826DRAFT_970017 [Russula brevipes]|nr:hypothetical protein BC826DRAFT_970017 [Russula brevipes]
MEGSEQKRWRRVVFASLFRLDLALTVSNFNPGHMRALFSPHLPPLPIDVDYWPGPTSAPDLGRIRAALRLCDRVRGINFRGSCFNFDKILKVTESSFPSLEILDLYHISQYEITLPATFLRGPVPNLRFLNLFCVFPESLSSLLSASATTLVDLHLGIDAIFDSSQAASLFSCLPRMRRLCSLKLEMQISPRPFESPTYLTKPEPIELLSLTRFHFFGFSAFLNAFVTTFTAPSLQDVNIGLGDGKPFPISNLTRFIGDATKLCRSIQVIFEPESFRLSLLTCSEHIRSAEPLFRFYSERSPDQLLRMCSVFPELATVEELFLSFSTLSTVSWHVPWRQFLRKFWGVKVLRVERGNILDLAYSLQPNDEGPAFGPLPVLEEIELCADQNIPEDELGPELVALQPFISARQRAGRPVRPTPSLSVFPPYLCFPVARPLLTSRHTQDRQLKSKINQDRVSLVANYFTLPSLRPDMTRAYSQADVPHRSSKSCLG